MQNNNWPDKEYAERVQGRQGETGFSPDAPTFNSGVVGEEDRPEGVGAQGSGAYLQLLDAMSKLHLDKNAGYGSQHDAWSNFRLSEQWGVPAYIGCLVRMSDKYQRLQNLIADPTNDKVGESIVDTAMDLAAYALIFVCLWQEYLVRTGVSLTQGARCLDCSGPLDSNDEHIDEAVHDRWLAAERAMRYDDDQEPDPQGVYRGTP